MKKQVLALEPYVPGYRQDAGETLWLNGQNDAAIAMLKELAPDVVAGQIDLAQIYASLGRYSEGADVLQKIDLGTAVPASVSAAPAIAAQLLRTAPARSASPQSLPHLAGMGFVYLHVGASERALEYYEETAEAGFLSPGGMDNAFVWHPSYVALRKTERFKSWIRKIGYVDYWRAKGWPEFCHPTTTDDFVCA
jgi:tetratricopeptide (TPR) repeat protein